MGAEWLWEAECLPRVMLIARALTTGDRSFQHAAMVLAGTGYTPTVSCLRIVLLDRLASYKQPMTKRQTYLTENHPQAEKRKRLKNHMRRKMVAMPDSAFQPFVACIGALFGVITPDDPHVSDELKWLQQFFSFPALQQRLETIDDSTLLGNFEEAGRLIPTFVPMVLAGFNLLLLPLLKEQLRNAGLDTSIVPNSINLEIIQEMIQIEAKRTLTSHPLIWELRFMLAIFLMAMPTENIVFLTQLSGMFRDILSQILNHMGISPEPMVSLLSADTPSAQSLPFT